MRNGGSQNNRSSGHKNVYRNNKMNKWFVGIYFNGKLNNLCFTDDLDAAVFVASEYRDKYHGEFARAS
jgi:hypothetical protein